MKLNMDRVEAHLKSQDLNRQKHPTKDLWIYKYTNTCVFKKNWTDITLACRGLVMDADGNVVSNPMPKFFNIEEVKNVIEARLAQGQTYVVSDKMDGSLIMVFKHEGDLEVSSSGSLDSSQSNKAKEMIAEKYSDYEFKDGLTYVFEIIYPENRIVLDYGEQEGLTLLAIRDTETGLEKELDANGYFPVAQRIDKSFEEILEEKSQAEFINKEGYVVAFSSGSDLYRVKVKFDEYMRLHKIVSGVNEKYIWECLRDGVSMQEVLEVVPDEMFNWIKDYHLKLTNKFSEVDKEVRSIFEAVKKELVVEYFDRKDFARIVMGKYPQYQSLLFALLDEQSIEKLIWKSLKPETTERQFGKGES